MVRQIFDHAIAKVIAKICPNSLGMTDIKIKLTLVSQMIKIVKHLQSLISRKRNDLCPQFPKCLMHGCLYCGELRLCFFKILAFDGDGKIPFLFDALPSLTDFLLYDVVVDLAELIKPVPRVGKQDIVPKSIHIPVLIVDRNLKCTVHGIKELAVPFKNVDLLILVRCRIVDVRKAVAFTEPALCHLKDPVLSHLHDLYCLLYGFRCLIKRLTRFFKFRESICE